MSLGDISRTLDATRLRTMIMGMLGKRSACACEGDDTEMLDSAERFVKCDRHSHSLRDIY